MIGRLQSPGLLQWRIDYYKLGVRMIGWVPRSLRGLMTKCVSVMQLKVQDFKRIRSNKILIVCECSELDGTSKGREEREQYLVLMEKTLNSF